MTTIVLTSEDKQFRLDDEGRIHWQTDPTNPLPGQPIARIQKGSDIYKPAVIIPEDSPFHGKEGIDEKIGTWLEKNIESALMPAFKLLEEEEMTLAAKEIGRKLYDSLGVLPRQELAGDIKELDEEGRAALRHRRVRMGPLTVFLPELNKPAGVKLRGLLWWLWHDKTLPAPVPQDGIVSLPVKDQEIDPLFYQSIGYPVVGPRAVRVDMLDRVVCAIYDTAKDGKFQAQHQMAEWLGSNIADLYAVLEALGHKKIHDPVEEKIKADAALADGAAEDRVSEEPKAPEGQAEEAASSEEVPAADKPDDQKPAEDKPSEKPELATFALKAGKAGEKRQPPKQRAFKDKSKDKPRKDKGPKDKKKKDPKHKGERKERIYTAEAKTDPADSPFAILQQLKDQNQKSGTEE